MSEIEKKKQLSNRRKCIRFQFDIVLNVNKILISSTSKVSSSKWKKQRGNQNDCLESRFLLRTCAVFGLGYDREDQIEKKIQA